jgi:hypothetical protein
MDAPIGGLLVDLGDQDALVGMTMAEGGQRVEESEEGATIATGSQLRCVEAIVDACLGTTDDVEGLIVH